MNGAGAGGGGDGQATPVFAGVIFDLDGVLTDTEHLWEENWLAYARRHRFDWRPEDTVRMQGMSVPEWSRYMAERIQSGEPPAAIAEIVIDGMVAALAAGRVELAPGARELVEAAAARVPVALASSAPRRLIDAVLTGTKLLPHFVATVSSEEVPRGKPSPDVYEAAARRLGLPPRRCLGVEDSSNGIRAAAAAGLTVIALPNHRYPPRPEALALAAHVARSLPEVQALLLAHLPNPSGVGR